MTDEDFLQAVRGIKKSAFRFETQFEYLLGYEQPYFEAWLAGDRTPPPQIDWWQPWLERLASWKEQGVTVSRVRVHEQPPTPYQRWMMWSTPWCARAGERIHYLPRRIAVEMELPVAAHDEALPADDWWLLDDETVIVMAFTEAGAPAGKTLLTGSAVDGYRELRDVAIAAAMSAAA
jgi:hypothetical protein